MLTDCCVLHCIVQWLVDVLTHWDGFTVHIGSLCYKSLMFLSMLMFLEITGHEGRRLIILSMQYGANYSGPG